MELREEENFWYWNGLQSFPYRGQGAGLCISRLPTDQSLDAAPGMWGYREPRTMLGDAVSLSSSESQIDKGCLCPLCSSSVRGVANILPIFSFNL